MRHPQRSRQEWRQLFTQQQQSGLSAVEFCRQHHINIQTFYARRSDIRLQQTQNKFVQVKREVTTVESQEFTATEQITLDYGVGQLSLPITVPPYWLAALMKALRE
jgi:hypothetical protein